MEDGIQLFSSTEEPTDADAYIEDVRLKSQKSFALAKRVEVVNQSIVNQY